MSENALATTWPLAYRAAADQLIGLGPKEPQKDRPAIRARVQTAAAKAFTAGGIEFARVSARLTWLVTGPTVELELITIAGQRHCGGAMLDPRMSPTPVPPTPLAGEGLRVAEATFDPRDLVETTPDLPPADQEHIEKFYAGMERDEAARLAKIAERTPS